MGAIHQFSIYQFDNLAHFFRTKLFGTSGNRQRDAFYVVVLIGRNRVTQFAGLRVKGKNLSPMYAYQKEFRRYPIKP